MECKKCGSTKMKVTLDSRGLAEARCADCGSLLKKMKTSEVIDYYEKKISEGKPEETIDRTEKKRMPCRYCTENYVLVQGNLRTHRQYIPIEPNYCPVCGRELQPEDKKY